MPDPITQADVLDFAAFEAGDCARFFVPAGFPGLDCLTAAFRTHAYAEHVHETYTIGTIYSGCETWHARGIRHYAGPGDLVFNNPLVVHDGAPFGDGYAYRMSYPTVELIEQVASAVSARRVTSPPIFTAAVQRDPEGAWLFVEAHAALESGVDGLAGEEILLRAYGRVLVRNAKIVPVRLGREPGPVARVREAIEQRYAEALTLSDLAAIARLSTHHLIRAFRTEIGLTPHAYLVDVRVRRARDLLRVGLSPASVASAVGFADQAHLTRAFKTRIGVPPGAYRRATGISSAVPA